VDVLTRVAKYGTADDNGIIFNNFNALRWWDASTLISEMNITCPVICLVKEVIG